MSRVLFVCFAWLSLHGAAAGGCGGTAVVDGENAVEDDGGNGGSTSTSPSSCSSVATCCDAACALLETLPCNDDDQCECGGRTGDPGCEAAWLAFLQCGVAAIPQTIQCVGGDPRLNCSICVAERTTAEALCDGLDTECSDP